MQHTHPAPTRRHALRPAARTALLWALGIALTAALITGLAILARQPHPLPALPENYSLTPGSTGMLSSAGGGDYGLEEPGVEPTLDRVEARVNAYLQRLDQPNLELARLREFPLAYRADILDTATGHTALTLMIGKASLTLSPQAGPNLLWNTRYAPTLASLGGGYGMTGRMLPNPTPPAMTLTADRARELARQALTATGQALTLAPAATTHDGYYEFTLTDPSQDGASVGSLAINGYTGQAWQQTWPQPPRQDVQLASTDRTTPPATPTAPQAPSSPASTQP